MHLAARAHVMRDAAADPLRRIPAYERRGHRAAAPGGGCERRAAVRIREFDRRARQRLGRARIHGRRSAASRRGLRALEVGGGRARAGDHDRDGDAARHRAAAAGLRARREGKLPAPARARAPWPAPAVRGTRGAPQLRRRRESRRSAGRLSRSPGRGGPYLPGGRRRGRDPAGPARGHRSRAGSARAAVPRALGPARGAC